MKIEYTLDRVDFLEYQLFAASKSELIIKSRKRSRIRLPITYLILGLILFVFTNLLYALIFIGIGITWYLFQPFFMKRRYIRQYEKYIDENYSNRFGEKVTLDFEDEYIIANDCLGESKLKVQGITEINEIKNHIFIKFLSGESLIIPKKRISNLNELNSIVTRITSNLKIKHNIDPEWEWN